jgi:hypothetical protein
MHERLKAGINSKELTKIIVLDEIDRFLDHPKFLYNML